MQNPSDKPIQGKGSHHQFDRSLRSIHYQEFSITGDQVAGCIYLLKADSKLLAMEEAPYESESLLQKLLADHADLLAGDQIDAEEPRRWLLVTREMAVPGEPDGAGRWSLDHLFLDQDAIPTLVEVKRSSDTRIRREVIGQMLDYAANAVVYWPFEEIKARFESRCKDDGDDPDAKLVGLLGEGQDISNFWQSVKTNLQAGRVRLLFIADEIPIELRRVVEFLNSQMDPAEVLAIEVKQFVGENLKTLVPRVVGQTESARRKKKVEPGEPRQWDESSFFSELSQRRGEQEAAVARRLLDWANEHGLRIWWGQGKKDGSFFPMYDNRFGQNFLFSVWTYGNVEIQFQHMKTPPFGEEGKRRELAQRLSAIGVSISEDALKKRPTFGLSLLLQPGQLDAFMGAFDWVLSEIEKFEIKTDSNRPVDRPEGAHPKSSE
jgi:hypothetical protein